MSLPLTWQYLTQGQWPEGRLNVGIRGGEGQTQAETRTLLVCAAHRPTFHCGPNESSWVQTCMPAYSLNWIARSSVIQGGQRYQCCSSPTQRWPSRNQRPFNLESAIDFNAPSDTNAGRPSQVQENITIFNKKISWLSMRSELRYICSIIDIEHLA